MFDAPSDDHESSAESRTESLPKISRRTTLTAAAWSAPVIALAVSTPAAAASVVADGTLNFVPGPGTLNPNTNNFTYNWVISNSSTTSPISGPFTIEFNVPFGIQDSITKPPAGQASASNPTLFAPVAVNAPGYVASWVHTDGISDGFGNTRTETITIGTAATTLEAGDSIPFSSKWTVPENWLSTGDGSILLDRRVWTWRSEGTVTAGPGANGSPQAFPLWTTQGASENPASPGGLWAFSTPA